MPWVVRKDERCPAGKPWGVANQQTNDLRGCHPSREHGLRQAAALYATVADSRPKRNAGPEDATPEFNWEGSPDAAPDVKEIEWLS